MTRPIPSQAFDLCDSATTLGPGRWLLEASAGTGKTYTIVGILTRLLLETDIRIDQCVVMTFTTAATAELRERLRTGLHRALQIVEGRSEPGADAFLQFIQQSATTIPDASERLRRALIELDGALIATIHGFCHRLLHDHALHAAVPLAAELDGDLTAWRQGCIHDSLRDWGRRLSQAGAGLVAPALDPHKLMTRCQRLEQHPQVLFSGEEAIKPEVVDQRLSQVRAAWPDWVPVISAFFSRHMGTLGNQYGPREMRDRLQAIGATLATIPDREYLEDLIKPILAPAFRTKADKQALAEEPWHTPLLVLMRSVYGVERNILERYRASLQQRPRQSEHLHYNDLLSALSSCLEGPQGAMLRQQVRGQHAVALVDEFQDTDQQQWRIFEQLFGGPAQRLFLIGDPKQAIYGFRGADVQAYLAAAETVPPERCYTLATNYRSDRHLVEAVNDFFDRGPLAFVDPGIGFQRVTANHGCRFRLAGGNERPLQIWWQESDGSGDKVRTQLADRCAHEIARVLADGEQCADGAWHPLQPQDIAVLVPSHHHGAQIAEALNRLPEAIPSVRTMRTSVFTSPMAQQLALVLAAVLAPHRERKVRAAAITRLGGLSSLALADADQHEALERMMARLRVLRQRWFERGFATAWQALIDDGIGDEAIRVLVAGEADGERHLTDLLHLGDLLVQASGDQGLGPEALVQWLERQVADPVNGIDDQHLRLDRDDNAVRVMTIHAAKGLEFPVVFVPFLWSGGGDRDDPIYYNGHQALWAIGRNPKVARLQQAGALAEQVRLAYVALTRARFRCYLGFAPHPAWSKSPGCTRSALTWLAWGVDEVPAGDMSKYLKDTGKVKDPDWQAEVRDGLWQPTHQHATLVQTQEPVAWRMPTLGGRRKHPAEPVATWSVPVRQRHFSSYSGLIRNRPVEERDHDQVRDDRLLAVTAIDVEEPLPRGPQFGTAVHEVLEKVSFDADIDALTTAAATALAAQGISTAHAPALGRLLDRVLAADVPGADGADLRIVARRRLAELEVLLPVADRTAIAAVFAAHGGPWQDYATAIADITIPAGFFTGIVDLIFAYGGRFHVLDWKTNDLARKGGYGGDALELEMRHHHYVLQYHLYLVALQRYLRLRLPDYDYDEHIGDAHYVFVRGVDGSGAGWYRHRPAQAMIDGLEACFGGQHG